MVKELFASWKRSYDASSGVPASPLPTKAGPHRARLVAREGCLSALRDRASAEWSGPPSWNPFGGWGQAARRAHGPIGQRTRFRFCCCPPANLVACGCSRLPSGGCDLKPPREMLGQPPEGDGCIRRLQIWLFELLMLLRFNWRLFAKPERSPNVSLQIQEVSHYLWDVTLSTDYCACSIIKGEDPLR